MIANEKCRRGTDGIDVLGAGVVHGWIPLRKHSEMSLGVVPLIRGAEQLELVYNMSGERRPKYLLEGSWYAYWNEDGNSDLPEVVYHKRYIQPYSCVEYGAVGYGISISAVMSKGFYQKSKYQRFY